MNLMSLFVRVAFGINVLAVIGVVLLLIVDKADLLNVAMGIGNVVCAIFLWHIRDEWRPS